MSHQTWWEPPLGIFLAALLLKIEAGQTRMSPLTPGLGSCSVLSISTRAAFAVFVPFYLVIAAVMFIAEPGSRIP